MLQPFEYEQQPASVSLSIYKLDHKSTRDGSWHPLNAKTNSRYRIAGGYFQLVAPPEHATDEQTNELLALLDRAGPLETDDELEILVRPSNDGYEMTSHWIYLGPGAGFADFTPKQWNDAYRRLRELEDATE